MATLIINCFLSLFALLVTCISIRQASRSTSEVKKKEGKFLTVLSALIFLLTLYVQYQSYESSKVSTRNLEAILVQNSELKNISGQLKDIVTLNNKATIAMLQSN